MTAARPWWALTPAAAAGDDPAVSLAQVTALLQKLGVSGRHEVAEDLLRIVSARVPMAQCTIFSFEGESAPRTVAIGDRSRTAALRRIAQDYVTRYHPLDGCRDAMRAELQAARRASAAQPHIVLHRQRPQDVAHPDYRRVCYALPRIAERIAMLSLYDGWRWLSVNFYRGEEHGPLTPGDLRALEALAPLVVHAVRLHYAGQLFDTDLAEWLLARLHRQHPRLSKRDLDVLRGVLHGLGNAELAQRLGLTLSSAQTYVKRVYRKLGVDGQRELMGLLIQGGRTD
ncbi:LuxR family transcriptional regulator [Tepidimonas ignava]|uniref:Bacterial regulatory protein n=1 Tax=Tepidimonas ignava TaxID=114249 RepID=A0A4R3LIT0_9BURK|nr:helix-turn-helix transcriptional regulator [Tepidimonas ignava]TCS99435.1 LuxR family transcriptional regulator [Tepidimonas ignava]TSE21935.1 Bacterial regulatory protein [Tepidimonas ignava]